MDDLLPKGVNANFCRSLTELYAGDRGIEKIDEESLQRFPNLQVVWLNDNRLSKVAGLGSSFRVKELYLQNNAIATLTNPSCCLPKLRHLQARPQKSAVLVLLVLPHFSFSYHLCH